MKRKQEPTPPAPPIAKVKIIRDIRGDDMLARALKLEELEISEKQDADYDAARIAFLDEIARKASYKTWKDFEDACLRVGGIIRRG